VDVLISTDPGDPELVTIAVTDSGIGIAPADLLRVFEPFAQADERVTRRAAGTGLGLTISRNLARRLGGDIDVRSELGQGSTFTARLRLPPLGTTPVPQARSTSPALVLGSDSAFSASFVALAPCIGRRAEGFTNPDALLSRAESSVGSPILIDARLPLDAVIATAKRLRTRGHEGPVWRVGYLGIGPAVSWSDAGFDGSVPLPVFPETLVRLFERPLESAAATSIAAQPREVASDRIEPASESPDTPRVRSCRPSRR
jgi:FixJ family two-component response regulator